MAELEHALLWLRVASHLVTFVAVAICYSDPNARYRFGVSLAATVIAGSSLAAAIAAFSGPVAGRPFETAMFVTFAVLIVRGGGNVAHLLPKREPAQ